MSIIELVLDQERDISPGDILFRNRFYHKLFVFSPVVDFPDRMDMIRRESAMLQKALQESSLLKKSILDEDIPLEMELIEKEEDFSCLPGGRRGNAILLGMIKDATAIPNLIEAAKHDRCNYMRAESISSVGLIGGKAYSYASDISKILLSEKDFHVTKYAARALGKIGNPVALGQLRQAFEKMRDTIKEHDLKVNFKDYELKIKIKGWNEKDMKHQLENAASTLEDVIVAIFRLDPKQGREVLSIGLKDNNSYVYHHSKNACSWFSYYEKK